MRIAGGRLKGRPLHAPAGRATRPTSDRVREAIFNVLAHGIEDFDLEDARVLDLFAGTGALGLEALSRGARFALFVDEATPARAAIRRNAEALDVTGQVKIWRRDATRLGPCAPLAPFPARLHRPALRPGVWRSGTVPARVRRLARRERRRGGRGLRSRHHRNARQASRSSTPAPTATPRSCSCAGRHSPSPAGGRR
jgi:hypothetical protein